MTARLRYVSGLVLFAYATTHLANHALGVVSFDLMETGLEVFISVWRSGPGQVALYGAAAIHILLAAYAVYRRRRLRMAPWEWAQLVLGWSILPLGMLHFVGVRASAGLYDTATTYPYVLFSFYAGGAWRMAMQAALVLVVWSHACIGLHFHWRLRPWYRDAAPWLLAVGVALPTLALAGYVSGLREIETLSRSAGWASAMLGDVNAPNRAQVADIYWLVDVCLATAIGLLVGALLARPLRGWWERRRGVVRIVYGSGQTVAAPVGLTLLEISRLGGVPHASVCGGRGRCSTCRTRIGGAVAAGLPDPSAEERRVLDRVGAPANVRLACQLRPPPGELRATPLLPASAGPTDAYSRRPQAHGAEREIAVLFADIRGFTTLSEGKLPYDVVFVVNRYFRAVGEAIQAAGGHLDKFIGDGVMALFGVDHDAEEGCRRALDAARRMALAVDRLNESLSGDLDAPLRIGIGLHVGMAIVGEMGHGRAIGLTAIGDTVNTASRLESASKELSSELVVSEELLARAKLALREAPAHEIEVKGRVGRLKVRAVVDAATLPASVAASGGS